jgi:hypothetical protein
VAQFNINTDAAVVLTDRLEQLHRSALPTAIRQTLNSAAFDVKKITMLLESSQVFEQRNKSFLKAKSKVMMAKGFNLKSMRALVGFVGANKNQAVDDLEKQERGGTISSRSFIPIDTARISKSQNKAVKKSNRIGSIRNIDRVKSKKLFIKQAVKTGVGGYIIYKGTLFQVKSISRGDVKLLPLFSYEANRSVQVSATYFMKRATIASAEKMNRFYVEQANKQIKRLRK